MAGMSKAEWENGESTRSGLLWEVERILKELPDNELPQVLLMENVPQIHAEKNMPDFDAWLEFLESRGYINFWNDLNAKDYGIPQNRDRCFCVSIQTEEFIDFQFPEKIKLDKVMKDYLEEEVDEKYYITTEKANKFICQLVESGVLPEQNRTEQNRTEQSTEPLTIRQEKAESSTSRHVLQQGTTQESANISSREPVYSNVKKKTR